MSFGTLSVNFNVLEGGFRGFKALPWFRFSETKGKFCNEFAFPDGYLQIPADF